MRMKSNNISLAQLSEVPALVELVNSAYRGPVSKIGWTTEADLLDGIRANKQMITDMIATPEAVILKCCDDTGAIEGCVYLEKQDNKLYLGLLAVSPKRQAKGIGKLLLGAANEYALQRELKTILLWVLTVRHELIAWYERHGYRKTGETKPFSAARAFAIPKQPLEFLIMEKVL